MELLIVAFAMGLGIGFYMGATVVSWFAGRNYAEALEEIERLKGDLERRPPPKTSRLRLVR